ncbi:MAG: ROK family protein, partial [Chitinophagaceae bacterium]
QNIVLGVDIGGSHISAALVDIDRCEILDGSFVRSRVNSAGTATEILESWQEAISACVSIGGSNSYKVALAMPGPFDYENGISLIKDLHKYESLFGIDVKLALSERLNIPSSNILFRNDAEAFLAGEICANVYPKNLKTLGITLGTGLGSALSEDGITKDANFAMLPFSGTIAEEFLSTRWFTSRFTALTGENVKDVKEVLSYTKYAKEVLQLFEEFSQNLSKFLTEIMAKENFKTLVIGGNIAKTADRFLPKLSSSLNRSNSKLAIHLANLGEASAIIGASLLFSPSETTTKL